MIDTHCHADLYSDPSQVIRDAMRAHIGTVIVTNLPSAFERAYPFVSGLKGVKLAVGLHPLSADQHAAERDLFRSLVDKTRYVGEVGLDFSPEGITTREEQVRSFRFVLQCLQRRPTFMTLHSRRAESEVLELLREEDYGSPAVFHWYSGPLKTLLAAAAEGHYFSVNPAMVQSPHGRRVIGQIPQDRVLTETDGPFVQVGGRPAVPADVSLVRDYLSTCWNIPGLDVERRLKRNFSLLRASLGGLA